MNVPARQTTGLLTPTTMTEALEFSEMLAASSMVPSSFKNKAPDILVAIQWGSEVGLPPMSALQNIAVINGRPSIYGDAALALITSHSQYGGHTEFMEGEEAFCKITRKVGGSTVETTRSFSVADAKRAKLWGKAGPWSQYPKRMLQMRARGFCMRDSFPDALKGVAIHEEAEDFPTGEVGPPEMKDVTPANPLDTAFGGDEPEIPPVTEAPVDVMDPQTPVGPENTDAPVAAPVDDTGDSATGDWELLVDGDRVICIDAEMWVSEFSSAIARASNEDDVSAVDRRHAASVIKKENQDTLDRLLVEDPELGEDIKSRYAKLIRRLSAQAKKEEDAP
jgi:hypothetical protein